MKQKQSKEITQDEFDTILFDVLRNVCAIELIDINGIYEILAEEYNNTVLDIYENNQQFNQNKK